MSTMPMWDLGTAGSGCQYPVRAPTQGYEWYMKNTKTYSFQKENAQNHGILHQVETPLAENCAMKL